MDIDAIYAALQQADQQAAQDSYWSPVKDFASSFANILGQAALKQAATGEMDGGDYTNLALSNLGAGFLGGYANNKINDYKAEQGALARQVLLDAAQGGDVTAPEGMSPSVFSSVKNAGSIFALGKKLEDQDETRKLTKDFAQKVALQGVADKSEQQKAIFSALASAKTDYQRQQVMDAAQQMGLITAESRPMVDEGQNGLTAAPSEGITKYLNQTGGDEDLARTLYKRDIEAPDRGFDLEQKIRKEFSGLPEVQDFVASDIGINSLRNALADKSGTSDLELVRGAIQAIEPGMAVREGEQAAVANSASIPDEYKGYFNKALNGETGLSEKVRQGIFRIAERRYNEYAAKAAAAKNFYGQRAQQYGLDPSSITYLSVNGDGSNSVAVPRNNQIGNQAALSDERLKALARQFPRTPEGVAAFKAAVEQERRGR